MEFLSLRRFVGGDERGCGCVRGPRAGRRVVRAGCSSSSLRPGGGGGCPRRVAQVTSSTFDRTGAPPLDLRTVPARSRVLLRRFGSGFHPGGAAAAGSVRRSSGRHSLAPPAMRASRKRGAIMARRPLTDRRAPAGGSGKSRMTHTRAPGLRRGAADGKKLENQCLPFSSSSARDAAPSARR